MAKIFLCKKGELANASKRALQRAGVIVVEVDNPDACKFVDVSTEVVRPPTPGRRLSKSDPVTRAMNGNP